MRKNKKLIRKYLLNLFYCITSLINLYPAPSLKRMIIIVFKTTYTTHKNVGVTLEYVTMVTLLVRTVRLLHKNASRKLVYFS